MAPEMMRSAKLERPGGGGKRKIALSTAVPELRPASTLLLLDVLDHLSHVVLILAELGSVLEQFLVLLFGVFKRNRFFFLLHDVRVLVLELGIELLGGDRVDLLLNRRDRTRAAGFQKRLRIIGRATLRANNGFAQQIVVTGSAARTNSLS